MSVLQEALHEARRLSTHGQRSLPWGPAGLPAPRPSQPLLRRPATTPSPAARDQPADSKPPGAR